MPELAEVEFYRRQWDEGLNQKVLNVKLHAQKRIFRGTNADQMIRALQGAIFRNSEAHGKRMLFRFSGDSWLGLHLGMTGKLRVESKHFAPSKHDHLVLVMAKRSLVFSDPRLFGRVLFHQGKAAPDWWSDLPPALVSRGFSIGRMRKYLDRHRKAPIKAVLLQQDGFPGIGNWMADEILWQAQIHPAAKAQSLDDSARRRLHASTRSVAKSALRIIGKDFSDPPGFWLFKHRWRKKGQCPRCSGQLQHATIGGRTTCWCPQCQKSSAIEAQAA